MFLMLDTTRMSNLREVFLRKAVLVAVLSALAIPARAQSMQVYGKTGYLGEYELSSIVSEQVANGRREYSGPLAVKHVGLCTRDGPKETTGQIRFQLTGSSTRATATLVFEGVECTCERGSLGVVSWLHELRMTRRSSLASMKTR